MLTVRLVPGMSILSTCPSRSDPPYQDSGEYSTDRIPLLAEPHRVLCLKDNSRLGGYSGQRPRLIGAARLTAYLFG